MLRNVGISLAFVLVSSLAAPQANAEWVEQFSLMGDGNQAFGIDAFDDTVAVACGKANQGSGDQASIWYTANGGKAWTGGTLGGQFAFVFRVSYADAETVYGAGLGLHKSKDGGKSFAPITVPGIGGFDTVLDIFAVNTNYVYAIKGNQVIYTGNAGLNWQKTDTQVTQELQGLFFLDALHGWVVGGKQDEITETDPESGQEVTVGYDIKPEGLVLYSEDGARNWTAVTTNSPDIIRSIYMIDTNIGLATAGKNGNEYYIKRTTDGGKSWQDIQLPTPASGTWQFLTKAIMLTPLHAIAAGSTGVKDGGVGNKAVVIESYDGGVTWQFTPEAEGKGAYYDITFPCENVGWVAGEWGVIKQFNNGGGCEGSVVNPDGNPEAGGDVIEQDVWTWGHLFGTFGDDKLINEGSAPGDTDAWGGVVPGDDDLGSDGCKDVTKSTGCTAGSSASAGAVVALFAVFAALFFARRRNGALLALLIALPLIATACSQEETVKVCEEVAPQPQVDVSQDLGDDVAVAPPAFQCQLMPGDKAVTFTGTDQRKANLRNRIVFVRQYEEGGSDLFVMGPDGSGQKALTRFEDPNVEVFYPTWSPDRDYVAFISNYRFEYNEFRYNVFVIAADGSQCYQLTPDVESVRAKDATQTLTLQGSFRFGQGAIAAPVKGGTVAVLGGNKLGTTGEGGEFSVSAPAGKGKLVLRGTVNGMNIIATADYEGDAGDTVTLTGIVGKAEGTLEVGPLHWAPTGSMGFYFMKDTLVHTYSVQMNTGAVTPVFESNEDTVSALGILPSGGQAAVAFKSKPHKIGLYDLTDLEETVMEFQWEGQTEASRFAVSPLFFIASLQGDKVVLLGADNAGELTTKDVSPANLTGLVPEQFDWSLDATHLVLTVKGAAGSNLVSLDVNEKKIKVLTTDGKSSMPAWFGR